MSTGAQSRRTLKTEEKSERDVLKLHERLETKLRKLECCAVAQPTFTNEGGRPGRVVGRPTESFLTPMMNAISKEVD